MNGYGGGSKVLRLGQIATREHSSVGRALPLQGRGQQFESACSHTMRSWQAPVVRATSEPGTSDCVRRWGNTPADANGDCRKDQHREHTSSNQSRRILRQHDAALQPDLA
jgi:hypothetical protein